MNLNNFFKKNEVDDFAIISADKISAPAGFHPKDLMSSSKSVIIFAKQIPDFIFLTDNKSKTNYLYALIREMDKISYELVNKIIKEGYRTIPLPCFFPVKLKNGKLRGYLSYKHIAEQAGMGSIGLNSLLISGKYGNRLCLSAVITEKEFTVKKRDLKKSLCIKCNRCIESCPSRAIKNGNVKLSKCINFSSQVPVFLMPLFKLFMKWNLTSKYMEALINTLSWNIEMICSECLINCPYFKKTNTKNNKKNAG